MPGEVGFEHLGTSRCPELISLAGGPQIVDVEPAVGVEHLTVPDPDGLTSRAVDGEPDPAREVLTEVDDEPPVLDGDDRTRCELLGDAHRRTGIGDNGHLV